MSRALITGISGQDGSYLAELLLEKGYEVHGLVHGSTDRRFERLEPIMDRITLYPGDLLDEHSLGRRPPQEQAGRGLQPGRDVVGRRVLAPGGRDRRVHGASGVTRLLEGIREACPEARFYQASSSEMFGRAREIPQSEETPFYPRSPYGVAKVYGHFITVNYRESFGLHASSGILFNHESPRRGASTSSPGGSPRASPRSSSAGPTSWCSGNLDVRRDWGYAKEYVEAMWLMLQARQARRLRDRDRRLALGRATSSTPPSTASA